LSDQRTGPSPAGTTRPHTIVLALGNPLRGDDGVGLAVIEQVTQHTIPANVTVQDGGTPGLETVLLLQGYQRAIIVDAAEMDQPPGTWRRFTTDGAELVANDLHARVTVHYAGLAEALALGEALDVLPATLIIYGIQPQAIGWEQGLSAPVQAAVPAVSAAILDELNTTNEVKSDD
jgi:hydrogenase maturation protease